MLREKYIKVKKPIVTKTIATFIEETRDDDILDIKFKLDLYYAREDNKKNDYEGREIVEYFNNCLGEFIIARDYDYGVVQ